MAKKPTKTKAKPAPIGGFKQDDTIKKLRAENRALRKRVAELEAEAIPMTDNSEIVTVQVGPLMPWETALPNSFEAKS